jgi:hypothetical protein
MHSVPSHRSGRKGKCYASKGSSRIPPLFSAFLDICRMLRFRWRRPLIPRLRQKATFRHFYSHRSRPRLAQFQRRSISSLSAGDDARQIQAPCRRRRRRARVQRGTRTRCSAHSSVRPRPRYSYRATGAPYSTRWSRSRRGASNR